MDGVLADFVLGFTLIANKKFGTPVISTHSQREWNLVSHGLNGDQLAEIWTEINESPVFWYKLQSLATVEELHMLDSLCHDKYSAVHFITARCGTEVDEQTMEWLHRFGVCAEAVHVVNDDKSGLAKALGVTVAIDDKPETCLRYLDVGVPHVYLMNRLYNTSYDMPKEVVRVNAFVEFCYAEYIRRGVDKMELPELEVA